MDLTPTPEQYEWTLNHIWDLTQKYEGKFEIHVHCPHYARVVKQRTSQNFDEWYEHKFHGKCTYFAFGGYVSVTENGDLIPCFYTDLRPSEPMMLGNIRDKGLTKAWEEVQRITVLQAASKTETSSKANAESASTEKSAADAETEHTRIQETFTNQTQHAFTYQTALRKK